MKNDGSAVAMEKGVVHYLQRVEEMAGIDWTDHPAFFGVRLKHLIRGVDTDRRFSAHLVQIAPHCALADHNHAGQWELHEVLAGQGSCRLQEEVFAYHPGKMAVIPQGVAHSVEAGEEGLTMLATFFPALL
ncbi:MAG: cupin domain-containing protein [Desulfoprunum sp.]|nr:cupin domain-containing protein [Desulfoprunum sp.]